MNDGVILILKAAASAIEITRNGSLTHLHDAAAAFAAQMVATLPSKADASAWTTDDVLAAAAAARAPWATVLANSQAAK